MFGGVPRPAWVDQPVFARREGSSIVLYGSGRWTVGDCRTLELAQSAARSRGLAAISAFVDPIIIRDTRRRVSEDGIKTQHVTWAHSQSLFRFVLYASAWFDVETRDLYVLMRVPAPEEMTAEVAAAAAFGGAID